MRAGSSDGLFFSVIIPSYLGDYKGAASKREVKIIRAIESVLNQSYLGFEIIIVADGCEKTFDIVSSTYAGNDKVKCFLIEKQNLWSGQVRNFGISKANGDFITYLDIDDYWLPSFLKTINDHSAGADWVYFDNWQRKPQGEFMKEIHCEIGRVSSSWRPGTCNIAHRNLTKFLWGDNSYSHDLRFIESLVKSSKEYIKIPNPGYVVCHIPGRVDV